MLQNKTVCLLSGGLDSQVLLSYLRDAGHRLHALTIDYGQSNRGELECAKAIAAQQGVPHTLWCVSLGNVNPLTDTGMSLPSNRSIEHMTDIPDTYLPGRNTVLLSMGVALASQLGYDYVAMGAHKTDYLGYPDCREVYFKAYDTMLKVIHPTMSILTPFVDLSKKDLGTLARSLGVLTELSSSCYRPSGGEECKVCDACILREDTLSED